MVVKQLSVEQVASGKLVLLLGFRHEWSHVNRVVPEIKRIQKKSFIKNGIFIDEHKKYIKSFIKMFFFLPGRETTDAVLPEERHIPGM